MKRCALGSWAAFALPIALGACGPGPLAEAGGETLSIDQAAALIADHSTLPPDTQVVRVVAELWVDYTLLHGALVADTSLSDLDLSLATRQALDQIALARLAAEEVRIDSTLTDTELQARFAADMPGARATASQILLAFPAGATGSQRDSIRRHAANLRQRAASGEDFASLAGQYSSDPGSGRFGGSMGTFGRGQMLKEVDDAVFSMEVGEISEPVETEVGLHILRVDALEVPGFEQAGEQFRAEILERRRLDAEEAYLTELAGDLGLTVHPQAVAIVRALASQTGARLGTGARARPLATFEGGVYTVGDLEPLVQSSSPAFLQALSAGPDSAVRKLLEDLGKQRMLVQRAESQGWGATAEEVDSVGAEARTLIRDLAREIGLFPAPDMSSGGGDAVKGALQRVVAGEQEIIPLAGITFLLRNQRDWVIRDEALEATMTRARQLEGGTG
jgi:parvulin-like peptidyl-prolyl isomerase